MNKSIDVTLSSFNFKILSRALFRVFPVVLPHSNSQHNALIDFACFIPILFTSVSNAEVIVDPRVLVPRQQMLLHTLLQED